MRRILQASALVFVLAAAGVLGAAAPATAAPGNGTNRVDETDTAFSGTCGIPIVEHAVGVDRYSVSKDGLTSQNTFNVSVTWTNPATGGSFTYKNTGNFTTRFTFQADGSFVYRQTFSGVNYRVVPPKVAFCPRGRARKPSA